MPVLRLEVGTRTNLLCSQRPIVKCSRNSDSVCGEQGTQVTLSAVPHRPSHGSASLHKIRRGHEPSPSTSLKHGLFWGKDVMLFLDNF